MRVVVCEQSPDDQIWEAVPTEPNIIVLIAPLLLHQLVVQQVPLDDLILIKNGVLLLILYDGDKLQDDFKQIPYEEDLDLVMVEGPSQFLICELADLHVVGDELQRQALLLLLLADRLQPQEHLEEEEDIPVDLLVVVSVEFLNAQLHLVNHVLEVGGGDEFIGVLVPEELAVDQVHIAPFDVGHGLVHVLDDEEELEILQVHL